jgi:hypothetical protein
MDVLCDLEHGVWGNGVNGLVEVVINVLTLGRSRFVPWTRVHHAERAAP